MEFALNSTKSAAAGFTPAFMWYGRELVLPLEHAVRRVIDYPVAFVFDKVAHIYQTVKHVKQALNRTTAGMTA